MSGKAPVAIALSCSSAAIANPRDTAVSIVTPTGLVMVCGREQVEALLQACLMALGKREAAA